VNGLVQAWPVESRRAIKALGEEFKQRRFLPSSLRQERRKILPEEHGSPRSVHLFSETFDRTHGFDQPNFR
jgi:hypothetical protein